MCSFKGDDGSRQGLGVRFCNLFIICWGNVARGRPMADVLSCRLGTRPLGEVDAGFASDVRHDSVDAGNDA